ncbi:unnamed protein product [Closterium sp. NIES-64]|nr:unnamed protein product [Closterium sp. NIES-64]
MSLTEVVVSSEVWLTCATHALSTEAEEIMGLLLGDIHYDHSGRTPVVSAKIWGAAPQVRADRRKDRVETTPEQLAAASAEAESAPDVCTQGMSQMLDEGFMGVIYSYICFLSPPCPLTLLLSSPDVRTQGMFQMLDEGFVGLSKHLYVPPNVSFSSPLPSLPPFAASLTSDVRTQGMYHMLDEGFVGGTHISPTCAHRAYVRTQGMYQMLDEGFVGLIFSAFNRASSHAQVPERCVVDKELCEHGKTILPSLPLSPSQAGQLQAVAFQSVSARDKEQREQRSRHTPARGQWAQLGTKREHSSHPSVSDLEPQELAVVLAAVDDDVPSSDFTAWEVPIKVVSSARAFPSLPRAHAVAPLTGLQRMLLVEEKEAYEKAVEHAGRWVVMLQRMLLMEEKEAYEKAVEEAHRYVHTAMCPSTFMWCPQPAISPLCLKLTQLQWMLLMEEKEAHGEPNPLELIHRHRRLPGLPIILSFPSPLLSPLPSPLPTLSLPLFPPSPLPSSHPLPSPLSTPDTASLTLWS